MSFQSLTGKAPVQGLTCIKRPLHAVVAGATDGVIQYTWYTSSQNGGAIPAHQARGPVPTFNGRKPIASAATH